MARIVIVHGIHTEGGSVYDFGKRLEFLGYEVEYFDYAKRWAFHLFFPLVLRRDGARLANFMRDGDHVIAHSNGALVWQSSITAGAKWGHCFIFGGAATSDKMEYPQHSLLNAFIVYNVKDWALKLGALIPFHPFGRLGLRGFAGTPTTGKDDRFQNVRGFYKSFGLNHSHYFTSQRNRWLDFVVTRLKEYEED